ncbi:hypothetical protein GW17_00020278, partial [Ensete ventricosum]
MVDLRQGVMTAESATRSAIMGIAWMMVGSWMEVAMMVEGQQDTKNVALIPN